MYFYDLLCIMFILLNYLCIRNIYTTTLNKRYVECFDYKYDCFCLIQKHNEKKTLRNQLN